MVSVTVSINKNTYELDMHGHAEYCPGNDIVCSACSALAGALIGWVHNNPKHIKKIYKMTGCKDLLPGAGRAYLKAKGGKCLQSAFMTAVIGLCQVSLEYPKNVRVTINETLLKGDREGKAGLFSLEKGEK